jgi:hypothetical protein
MHDIVDVIKNLQTLSENNNSFKVLKDFERVIDELDLYVFKNWNEGEIIEGPNISRYDVTCKFMWPRSEMPDPEGGRRLSEYGCKVLYKRDHVMVPRKIRDPKDYRPGTKKGKIDSHPIWIVEITMPKKLMQDVEIGKEFKEQNKLAELMRYSQSDEASATPTTNQTPVAPETAAPEAPQ